MGDAEQAPQARPSTAAVIGAPAVRRPPRKIILFSDGTGNSSGKLFKTNVWRLYEALDLGPGDGTRIEQIALYSNGVGTSTFRPLAVLGGVLGIGLKANILELYKFLCRNWQPDDEIYLFGFSRGAFTIRLLTGLITSQGVLRGGDPHLPPDEDQLAYLARAAYRAFSGESWPNRQPSKWIAHRVRRARDAALELHRRFTGRHAYDPAHNCMTDIAFVGVWDTVAAYGGPIVEITRGIDDWIWPLTMPNYQLSPKVARARHALSLDDERDAFQPLLWDEVREELLVRWGDVVHVNGEDGLRSEVRQVAEGRLKQVWFSGMHADVGGGYPDESLSYVSLLWMIDELDGALLLIPEFEQRIKTVANSYGPIHNSRAGAGAYYRFQPRRIDALVDWLELPSARRGEPPPKPGRPDAAADEAARLARATRSLRDPEIADRAFRLPPRPGLTRDEDVIALERHVASDHGLLRSVRVHESAIARIVSGTDNYAPLSLPHRYDIVFAKRGGSSPRQLAVEAAKKVRDDQRDSDLTAERRARHAHIWDMVWWRRVQYFGTVALTLAIVALPLWDNLWDDFWNGMGVSGRCVDSRCVVRPVLSLIDKLTGGYAAPWVGAVSRHVVLSGATLAAIILLLAYGGAYELRLRGRARQAWRAAVQPGDAAPAPSRRSMARVREASAYQRAVTVFKWRLAPAVTGLLMIAAAVQLTVAAFSQLFYYPGLEEGAAFDPPRGARPARPNVPSIFSIADGGHPLAAVEKNETYTLRLTMIRSHLSEPDSAARWRDASFASDGLEIGHGANLPWWIDIADVPFRRVLMAGWLEPLVRVRAAAPTGWLPRLGSRVSIARPGFACDSATGSYVATVRPAFSGELSVFVNDAVLPGDPMRFYRNNRGWAVVELVAGSALPAKPPVRPGWAIRCVVRE